MCACVILPQYRITVSRQICAYVVTSMSHVMSAPIMNHCTNFLSLPKHSAVPESVTISPNLKSSTVNPTTVTDHYWVSVKAPHTITSSFGKWLVFKQLEELDETWHMIQKAVESGQLGATGAKCSTAKPDPSSYPMDSNIGVICIYTSEEMMDEVGFDLVKMVKQDIRCKMDEATLQGLYRARGYMNVSLQTIYWNDGDPYLKKYEEDKGDSKNNWTRILKANVCVCV